MCWTFGRPCFCFFCSPICWVCPLSYLLTSLSGMLLRQFVGLFLGFASWDMCWNMCLACFFGFLLNCLLDVPKFYPDRPQMVPEAYFLEQIWDLGGSSDVFGVSWRGSGGVLGSLESVLGGLGPTPAS